MQIYKKNAHSIVQIYQKSASYIVQFIFLCTFAAIFNTKDMENLFATSRELINRVSTAFVRDKHDEIDWNSRLISNVYVTRLIRER